MPTLSRSSSRTIPWFSGTATSVRPALFISSSSVGTASYTAAVHALRVLEDKTHLRAPLAVPLTILGLAGPEPHAGQARNVFFWQLLLLIDVGGHSGGRLRASFWESPLKQPLRPFVQFWPFLFSSLLFYSVLLDGNPYLFFWDMHVSSPLPSHSHKHEFLRLPRHLGSLESAKDPCTKPTVSARSTGRSTGLQASPKYHLPPRQLLEAYFFVGQLADISTYLVQRHLACRSRTSFLAGCSDMGLPSFDAHSEPSSVRTQPPVSMFQPTPNGHIPAHANR